MPAQAGLRSIYYLQLLREIFVEIRIKRNALGLGPKARWRKLQQAFGEANYLNT